LTPAAAAASVACLFAESVSASVVAPARVSDGDAFEVAPDPETAAAEDDDPSADGETSVEREDVDPAAEGTTAAAEAVEAVEAEPETAAAPKAGPSANAGATAGTERRAAKEAEEDGGKVPKFLRPVEVGSEALVLGGYVQPGFVYVANTNFNADSGDGFDFANARLTGKGKKTVKGRLYVGFKFNFDVNRGNFGVRDVYGTVAWRDDLVRIDIGQMKQPFGLALIQSESMLQFPLSPSIRLVALGRDQGLRLSSQGVAAKRVWLKGSLMMANGEGGFRQLRNPDDTFQYTGRFEVGPLGELEMSESDLHHSPLRVVIGANAGHTQSLGKALGLGDVGARETRVGGDVRVAWHGLTARAEYIHGLRGPNGDEGSIQRYGTAAQAGYLLPFPDRWLKIPKFEVVFRFQQLDIDTDKTGLEDGAANYVVDNGARRIYEPGLNIYLFEHHAKLLLSYQLTDIIEEPFTDAEGGPLIGDAFLAFFQFAWI
jgi:hypothetical protein